MVRGSFAIEVGNDMPVVFGAPRRYIQGPGELGHLGAHVAHLGHRAFIVLDPGTDGRVGQTVDEGFSGCESASKPVFRVYDGPCSERACRGLARACVQLKCDCVVGMGGGKMLDIAKAVAYYAELPLCVAPTVASSDAPCSALSVLYDDGGSFDKYLHLDRAPDLVVVDSAVIAHAPAHLLLAGMGDALATYFEARACRESAGENELAGAPGVAAMALARSCFEVLMADGLQAKADVEAKVLSPAVERVIECNILCSGIGFESGGLSLAHAVANGLAALEGVRVAHGLAVTYGLSLQFAVAAKLTGKPLDDDEARALAFCHAAGLPTCLADLGLGALSEEDLHSVAARALSCTRNIGNVPYVLDAGALERFLRVAC